MKEEKNLLGLFLILIVLVVYFVLSSPLVQKEDPGVISHFGMILVRAEDRVVSYPDSPDIEDWGAAYYSSKLLKYHGKKLKMTIDDKQLKIFPFDEKGMSPLEIIDSKDLYFVDVDLARVIEGYVLSERLKKHHKDLRTLENLKKAEKGIKPDYFDNSPFPKVDSNFSSRRVVRIKFLIRGFDIDEYEHIRDEYIVLDMNGNTIPHKIVRPLSFEKWGVPCPESLLLYEDGIRIVTDYKIIR